MWDDVVEWRLEVGAVLRLLLPVLMFLLQTPSAIIRVVAPSGDRQVFDVVWLAITASSLMISAAVLGTAVVRTRTRLSPDGVETRVWRTHVRPYADIADVRVDRASSDRTIKLTLTDGSTSTLPAPTRGLRKASDTTLTDAVSAIRRTVGLEPAELRPLP